MVRAARAADLADEEMAETLLAIVDDRNRMVHDYGEKFADELYERVKSTYVQTLRGLLQRMEPKA